MIIYKVYYWDDEKEGRELIGVLYERRGDLRGLTHLESGLKWATMVFGGLVNDRKVLVVEPKELKEGREHWLL